MNSQASTSLADITALVSQAGGKPPVERWNPAHCGALDLTIKRDGTWLHEGTPIARKRLVKLFASVLRREPDDGFVLVTPGEKLAITVEDAPLLIVETRIDGEGEARRIGLRDNMDDWLEVGPDHPLRLVSTDAAFKPYALVRGRLEGLANRSVAQELADLIEPDGSGLWAGGVFFPVIAA